MRINLTQPSGHTETSTLESKKVEKSVSLITKKSELSTGVVTEVCPDIQFDKQALRKQCLTLKEMEWFFSGCKLLSEQMKDQLESEVDAGKKNKLRNIKALADFKLWQLAAILYKQTERPNPQKAKDYLKEYQLHSPVVEYKNNQGMACKLKLAGMKLKSDEEELLLNHANQIKTNASLFSLRYIRKTYFGKLNWIRLGIVRVGQATAGVVAFFAALQLSHNLLIQACKFISANLHYLAPALAWLSFCFYAPRILINLGVMFKHVYYEPCMSEAQKALTVSERFQLEWSERWFQLGNDIVWFSDGLAVFLIAMYCSAAVSIPLGLILVGALYIFDVINSYLELKEARNLEAKLLAKYKDESPAILAGIREHCKIEVAKKLFDFNITVSFLFGKLPALVMGCVALVMGVGILTNPYVLGVFCAAALLVLATHLANKFLKNKFTPEAKIEANDLSLNSCGQSMDLGGCKDKILLPTEVLLISEPIKVEDKPSKVASEHPIATKATFPEAKVVPPVFPKIRPTVRDGSKKGPFSEPLLSTIPRQDEVVPLFLGPACSSEKTPGARVAKIHTKQDNNSGRTTPRFFDSLPTLCGGASQHEHGSDGIMTSGLFAPISAAKNDSQRARTLSVGSSSTR